MYSDIFLFFFLFIIDIHGYNLNSSLNNKKKEKRKKKKNRWNYVKGGKHGDLLFSFSRFRCRYSIEQLAIS